MTRRNPLAADPALEAEAVRRREELAGDEKYQRGVAAAKAQTIANARHALDAQLSRLKRATLNRDVNQAGRDHYEHARREVVKAAERLALATGESIAGIPRYLPPPAPTPEDTVTIEVPKPAAEPIPATMKDRGEALTSLPVFGSMLDAQLRAAEVVK